MDKIEKILILVKIGTYPVPLARLKIFKFIDGLIFDCKDCPFYKVDESYDYEAPCNDCKQIKDCIKKRIAKLKEKV